MALINCPECSEEVSDSAIKCPKCAVQLRKPKRSIMGKILKWSFVGFNLIMAIWLFAGMSGASESIGELSSDAERAGAAIGTGLAATMLLVIWFFGDVILGLFVLFTRPKTA